MVLEIIEGRSAGLCSCLVGSIVQEFAGHGQEPDRVSQKRFCWRQSVARLRKSVFFIPKFCKKVKKSSLHSEDGLGGIAQY